MHTEFDNADLYDPRLHNAITPETPSTGVSTTPDGRVFLVYPRIDGSIGPQIVEWDFANNRSIAYPNEEINSYTEGKDPSTHFIRVNAQRVGPDGALWLVDTGAPGFGAPVILPEGPKLIQVNVTTNSVQRTYPMGNVTRINSLLDDVRFSAISGKAYLTDAGAAALIVLDLDSGHALRLLEDAPSTKEYMPVSAEGSLLRAPGSTLDYLFVYADQLEVSPDGECFYFQPASGGMSVIKTEYLDNAYYNSSLAGVLEQYVEPFAHTPSTGGTAIDAQGNIYCSDTDRQAVLKIAPNGTQSVLVEDPRLLWVDAMWIDAKQQLWLPAAQLNRGAPFNNGTDRILKPLFIFTIDIGVGPSPIDHK
ncbi:major royal jelly protein [Polychaeton citri CBS 116435]|uniref:Major royal jelly protein n=1 Tax=Polychaeton citri CBS 116435 TaxID=1314669 RepID=A0A9P4Q900_9PEZI|nr:major royal jelly protein [Polychaeton citri CBS 116435]